MNTHVLAVYRATLVLLVSMAYSAPAYADWQFTKWGMSEHDVLVASKNAAAPAPPGTPSPYGLTTKLVMPYATGGFNFEARFAFDASDRLSYVSLRLQGGEPNALLGQLETKYGSPTGDPGGGITTWQTDRDVISFASIGDFSELNYKPRETSTNRGL